jgi:hypothetical protein
MVELKAAGNGDLRGISRYPFWVHVPNENVSRETITRFGYEGGRTKGSLLAER